MSEEVQVKQGDDVNQQIGSLLDDCAVCEIWGRRLADSTRDLLIEVARNALQHGAASSVIVSVKPSFIEVSDDGTHFDPLALPNISGKRGGAHSIHWFMSHHSHEAVVVYKHDNGLNSLLIALIRDTTVINDVTECVINLADGLGRRILPRLDPIVLEECGTIYITLPNYFCASDINGASESLASAIKSGKNLVFIGGATSDGVENYISMMAPRARFMRCKR